MLQNGAGYRVRIECDSSCLEARPQGASAQTQCMLQDNVRIVASSVLIELRFQPNGACFWLSFSFSLAAWRKDVDKGAFCGLLCQVEDPSELNPLLCSPTGRCTVSKRSSVQANDSGADPPMPHESTAPLQALEGASYNP